MLDKDLYLYLLKVLCYFSQVDAVPKNKAT